MSALLAVAGELDTPGERATVVEALAPRLPDTLLPDALAVARLHGDRSTCAKARAGLLEHVPGRNRIALVSRALDRTGGVSPAAAPAWCATGLLAYLPLTAMAALAAASRQLPDLNARVWTLARLAPWLPDPEQAATIAEILARASSLDDAEHLLDLLAPHLPPELMDDALDRARYGDSIVTGLRLAGRRLVSGSLDQSLSNTLLPRQRVTPAASQQPDPRSTAGRRSDRRRAQMFYGYSSNSCVTPNCRRSHISKTSLLHAPGFVGADRAAIRDGRKEYHAEFIGSGPPRTRNPRIAA
jgi:hypothetical protein